MLSLTQTSGYAVLALSCLNDPGRGWILAKDIVKCTGVPGPYLSQILHALSRAGLIETKRGYQGGYRLCRHANAITVLDVVEAVDGPACFAGCLLGLKECSDERACPTHAFWKTEKARIREYLAGLSLSEVAAYEKRALGLCASGTPFAGRCGIGQAGPTDGGPGIRLRGQPLVELPRKREPRKVASVASSSRTPPDKRPVPKRRRK